MATKPDALDKKRRTFEAELSLRLRERAKLLLSSETEVLRTLVDARTQIQATLASQPSDWKLWQLSRLLGQIDDVLTGATGQVGTVFGLRLQDAWNLGEDFVDKPLAIIGHRVELQLAQLDATVLKQMRAFGSLRLRDVGTEALRKISTELGLVTIGGKSPFDAIKTVQKILGNDAPQRAAAIVRTEVSRAFALALMSAWRRPRTLCQASASNGVAAERRTAAGTMTSSMARWWEQRNRSKCPILAVAQI